jgi:heptaprenyl diphosphate synthase
MNINDLYDEKLIEQLNLVKSTMQTQTKSGDAYLNGSLDYLMVTGGKMLRPAFLLTGSRFGKNSHRLEDDLIKLATAIETIHLATLIHDDIIDEAAMRRGRPSIQGKYGQSYAVYMGDYLLSQCFLMLTHLEIDKDLAIQLAKVVTRICVGDMKQHQLRYNLDITPYQYIKMVSGKTAVLFSIALSSGAYHSKANDEVVKTLGRLGYEIGMSFQLVDDLLDYLGEAAVVGKELQVDVGRGYYSMPIIYALQEATNGSRRLRFLLENEMDHSELEEVFDIVKSSGAIEKTHLLAKRYNDRALALVEQLPSGKHRTMLKNMIAPLLSRLN